MRKIIAKIAAYAGLIGGFGIGCLWAYFIWGLDWGVSYRSHGLMFLAMSFGALTILVVCYFTALFAVTTIDREQ